MTEHEKKAHRCCFTGHRPEKLKLAPEDIMSAMEEEIRRAYADGFNVFISGMAPGVDMWAAEVVLRLRNDCQLPIKLIAASPFVGFERSWSKDLRDRYLRIINEADLVRYISPSYFQGCFQVRNECMVDHSTRVISVFNGQKGGTLNTINYARKKQIQVINLI